MPKYRIHEWHYTRNQSYPPGSIVEYPETVAPHPQWERIDDESESESEEKAKGRGGRRGRTTTSEEVADAGAGSETHSKDEGNALRASDVGV